MSILLQPYKKAEVSFKELRDIGQEGRNSEVHLAFDVNLGANIVIKKMPKDSFEGGPSIYFEEAKILHKSSHQNVVPVQYACEDNEFIYIALPYFEKGSLKQRMGNEFLTIRDIVRYGCQFLSGLHNIHSKGLIHFDIKPDNILLSKNDEALVSDFGLSKHMGVFGLAAPDKLYPKTLPPEVFIAKEYGPEFDIYQAGVCLYRMCNGEEVFNAQFTPLSTDNQKLRESIQNGTFPDRSFFLDHIPAKLKKVICRAMSVDPDDRFPSVLQMLNSLAEVNENLDWQYSSTGDHQKWEKVSDGKTISIKVQNDGSAEAFKVDKNNASRRIVNYCVDKLSNQQLRRFMRDH